MTLNAQERSPQRAISLETTPGALASAAGTAKSRAECDADPVLPSTRREFWAMFALKHLLGVHSIPRDPAEAASGPAPKTAAEKLIRRLEDRVLQKLLDETRTVPTQPVGEVLRFDAAALAPHEFLNAFYRKNQPVVIEGLIKDSKAVRDWRLPWFKQHYGSTSLQVLKSADFVEPSDFNKVTEHLTIGEAIDRMLAGQRTYITNFNGIFAEDPELIKDLDPQAICRYTTVLSRAPAGLHLFIGGKRTGSSLHCASGGNFFCTIHGEKRWTLAHPAYTPYMYPTLHTKGIYAVSAIDALKSLEELDQEGYRLWRRVPKFVVHLKPGDVYFNPQWWWHLVENPCDTSIGLAFRVVMPNLFVGNPVFQALALSSPHMMKITARWIVTRRPVQDADVLHHLFTKKPS